MLCSFLGNIPHYRDILSFWNTGKPTLSINWSLIFFETHFFFGSLCSLHYLRTNYVVQASLNSLWSSCTCISSITCMKIWYATIHTAWLTQHKSYMKISRETSFLTALARRPFLSHSLLWDCQWAWGVHYSICAQGQSLSWLLAYSRREVSPSSSQGEPQAWHTDILW